VACRSPIHRGSSCRRTLKEFPEPERSNDEVRTASPRLSSQRAHINLKDHRLLSILSSQARWHLLPAGARIKNTESMLWQFPRRLRRRGSPARNNKLTAADQGARATPSPSRTRAVIGNRAPVLRLSLARCRPPGAGAPGIPLNSTAGEPLHHPWLSIWVSARHITSDLDVRIIASSRCRFRVSSSRRCTSCLIG
jgi:hypothetical protein